MALSIPDSAREFLLRHAVARLATAGLDGQPSVVPVCYVFDGGCLYSPIDEKPKRVTGRQLQRVRNIEANPHVALVVDDYSPDWSQLAYLLISGRAVILEPDDSKAEHARAVALLREKYPQYRSMAIDRRPMIKITPTRVKHWLAQQ
jgi:PPOX class probable F420-dependent enzyme